MVACIEKTLLNNISAREMSFGVRQREFAERLQERLRRCASGFWCAVNIFSQSFPKPSGNSEKHWCCMINLVYGVCRSLSLQPFQEELGHSKYIYRKGVSPEGGDDRQVMEGYYWNLVILVADLCLLQTNRRASAS